MTMLHLSISNVCILTSTIYRANVVRLIVNKWVSERSIETHYTIRYTSFYEQKHAQRAIVHNKYPMIAECVSPIPDHHISHICINSRAHNQKTLNTHISIRVVYNTATQGIFYMVYFAIATRSRPRLLVPCRLARTECVHIWWYLVCVCVCAKVRWATQMLCVCVCDCGRQQYFLHHHYAI